ncbi:MAG: pyruvate ferredoxin oxidoreductase, partial [Actinobacteria bacterium]
FSNVNDVVKKVAQEYASISGRNYGLFKTHQLIDAEIAIVVLSSTGGTARTIVDKLRAKGVKAGLLVPRVFRPFPATEIAEALSHLKAVAVMDRSDSFGAQGGPLFIETRHALYDLDKKIPATDYIFGLGGRDIRPEEIESVFKDLEDVASTGKVKQLVNYLGVRE